jgi:VanZ family protein
MTSSPDANRTEPGMRAPRPGVWVRWLVWLVYVAAWTQALLTPIRLDKVQASPELLFVLAKCLHVTAYAVLAILSGWLRVPWPFRWLLLAGLAAHGMATEFGQQFVATRHPSVRDVGLDWLGLAIGIGLSWKWWRAVEE